MTGAGAGGGAAGWPGPKYRNAAVEMQKEAVEMTVAAKTETIGGGWGGEG